MYIRNINADLTNEHHADFYTRSIVKQLLKSTIFLKIFFECTQLNTTKVWVGLPNYLPRSQGGHISYLHITTLQLYSDKF